MRSNHSTLVLAVWFAVLASPSRGQSISASFGFGGFGTRVIDPGINAYYQDTVESIATDVYGNLYVAGTAYSADFPQVNGLTPVSSSSCPACRIFQAPFVAKLDASGSRLIYSTLLGASDNGFIAGALVASPLLPIAVAVDLQGNAYITGSTSFPNFPVLKGASLVLSGGTDAFLVKLDPNGNLVYSVLFGGTGDDAGHSIAVSPEGRVFITGTTQSPEFPITAASYRASLSSQQDIFVTTFDAGSGKVLTSTYLGQGNTPRLALASGGQLLISASTTSDAWPTTPGALQPNCPGSFCAGVIALRFDPAAEKVIFATYVGDIGYKVLGAAVAGQDGSFYLSLISKPDGYSQVLQLNATGTAKLFSTNFGGISGTYVNSIAVDKSGNVYIGGQTSSPAFPVLYAIQPNLIPGICAIPRPDGASPQISYFCSSGGFVIALDATGTSLKWSTYLGDRASGVFALTADSVGRLSVAGQGISPDRSRPGGSASVVKFTSENPKLIVTSQSLTNSASLAPGIPFSGGLATVFLSGLSGFDGVVKGQGSPLPTAVAGVTVRVNGELAPILAVSSTLLGQQINFQVPFDFNTGTAVLQITQNIDSVYLGALPTAAGIFVLPDGTPAVQHAADYSLITAASPVIPGETIVIYATGLGQTTPFSQTGVPPLQPVPLYFPSGVSLGLNSSCEVLYAGKAPGMIGLDQINCKTPQHLAPGQQRLQIYTGVPVLLGRSDASYTSSNVVNLPVQ